MRALWLMLPLVACSAEFGIGEQAEKLDPDLVRADTDAVDLLDTAVLDTGDTAVVADTGADDSDAACDPASTWVAEAFSFPPDDLSCSGDQWVHFDTTYALWVGVVSCGPSTFRIYLSEDRGGPYLPALDLAGHGQDHCELLDPGFTIPNEDDITSGGCTGCSTSRNLPLEGVPGWQRAVFGEAFTYIASTGEWSWQTSQLSCGVDLAACVP